MSDFRMPSLGADMEAGTLVEWRVKPGDAVNRGDVVAEVETEKGIVEVEIWESGVVESLAVMPGTKVPVGTVLATMSASGVQHQSPATQAPATEALPPPPPSQPPTIGPPAARAPTSPAETRIVASPAARQLARERNIDIGSVRGTGPHGSVTRADVEHASSRLGAVVSGALASAAPTTAPVATAAIPVDSKKGGTGPSGRRPSFDATAMRRAISASMARSKREIPHYYLATDIDAHAAARWLEAQNATRSVTERILFAALLLKATALAAREVPDVNGFFVDGAFQPSKAVHLGVAISLRQGGLVAPAIHDVSAKSLAEVQASLRDLALRVRSGRLRSSEMSDPTLTVTNLGDQGVESVFGVIYPPQVALVGFGRVAERAWATGGMLGARSVVTATLSADHRVSDGHRGALFLAAIGRLLQEPEKL